MIGLLLFIIGAILGSFYFCLASRLPIHKSILGRSECDSCHQSLKWYELIPLVSYLIFHGKCHHCHHKIGFEYFIIEFSCALLFLAGYLYLGLTVKYFIYLVLISLGIIIFITDFKYMIILDSSLLISAISITVLKYFEGGIKYVIWSIFFGVCLFLTIYLIKLIGDFIFKKESLGGGDIKLSFIIGLALGYPYIGYEIGLIALIFASFLALPYALAQIYLTKKNELPFGPFLIASLVIVFVFYEKFYNLLIFF